MKIVARNKKISHKYHILERYTAGISLLGHEVKSAKTQSVSMEGAYVVIKNYRSKTKVLLRNLTIPPYQPGNQSPAYASERERELLLNKKEIYEIERELNNKGATVVPCAVGIERGKVKVEIALVRGKKKHDKREVLKKRDQERDSLREHKTRFS